MSFFKKERNYKIFLFSNSVLGLAFGLFSPFWAIFLRDFGGSIESYGFAIGLMALAQAVTSYFVGKYSDKIGRKPFLIIAGFFLSAAIFCYAIINSLIQLYILQIINGIASATQMTMETSFLGDVTKKASRGVNVGKYHAIVGAIAAIAVIVGGYIVGWLGFKIIFYITSILVFISTIILLRIKNK